MKWYNEYLQVFEKPFSSVPLHITEEVKRKLHLLQSDAPIASVVVIAYNDETRLLSCLWSLSNSKCKYPIEIIGVDNNSKDNTAEVYKATGIPYYTELKQSCGYARRRGLEEAKGKYYICIDSDTMYPSGYVQRMIEELEKPGVVAASATWGYVPSPTFPRIWMRPYEVIRDVNLYLQSFKNPELSVRGLVFAYVAELGRKVGYNVSIIRGEDGAMAFGLKEYGKISFVREKQTRAVTCTATLESDGSLINVFYVRVKGAFKKIKNYFVRTKQIRKDSPDNIIKKR